MKCYESLPFLYRRTKLLVLHVEDKDGENVYSIPDWENKYSIEIWKESWVYTLHKDKNGFHLVIK